jgi:cytochrome c553
MTTLARAIAALVLMFAAWMFWGSRSRDDVFRAPIARLATKHPWLVVGAMAFGIVIIAAAVVISGVIPIRASSGHWAITAALLDFAKTRSVATYSWTSTAPRLDDENLVLRGSGHYDIACASCHGGPGMQIPPTVAASTPPPPDLIPRIARWTPEQLFTIVKHGIKFTGMPAWPAQQRDDEVWAMVAFLQRLPQLDAAAYRRLTGAASTETREQFDVPDLAASKPPPAVQAVCWRCHGMNGTGRGTGAFPSLAGQRAEYLSGSLRAFRDKQRFSATMREIAAKLSDEDMSELAAYFAALPSKSPEVAADAASIARGKTIADVGFPDRDIPRCAECHGPTAVPKNPAYPVLAAQNATYLTSQLILLQERRRGGTPNVDLMHVFVNRLGRGEITDVARYFAATSP